MSLALEKLSSKSQSGDTRIVFLAQPAVEYLTVLVGVNGMSDLYSRSYQFAYSVTLRTLV